MTATLVAIASAGTTASAEELTASVATAKTTTTSAGDDVTATPAPAPSTPTSIATAASSSSAPPESVTVYERHRPNKVLMITGASLLVGTYAVTASFAGAGERAADRDLFVPGAGPFMNLANRNCSRGCTTDDRDTALIITSGVLQNVGAALMIVSAFVPDKVAAGQITAGPMKMNVVPTGVGLGAVGTF